MDNPDRLAGLLLRWHEGFEQGRDLPADELCRDCPELADELRQYIAFQKRMQRLTDQTAAGAPTIDAAASTPGADGAPAPAGPGTPHPLLAELLGPGETGLLGRYRVLRLLGQGGMGAVFLAEDAVAHRQVALKFMKSDAGSRARFLREARAAAQIEDDHVVRIYHVDEAAGVPFIVMPFLKGETLEARLRRAGGGTPLPAAEVLQIGREAALGLAAAHARGLIHRDVKPANLWLERREHRAGFRTLVLDFGLARPPEGASLTRSGAAVGTPGYMAPEQADGQAVDARADLFGLGCVLYRLATGRPAFEGTGYTALLRAVAEQEPRPVAEMNPQAPAGLADLITALLAKDPARRPASARAVVEALEQIAVGGAPTLPEAPKSVPPRRRARIYLGIAAGVLVLVLAGSGVAWLLNRPAPVTGDGNGPVAPPAVAARSGQVDIRVWRKQGESARPRRLRDPDAPLPLRTGDMFRIEAKADVPAYLYLFWIDTEGKAVPIYPWQPGQWGTRPADERPIGQLSLPPKLREGYTLDDDARGMETLLLLVREAPLPPDDAALRQRLAGLPRQQKLQNERSAVWFRNWQVDEADDRRSISFSTGSLDDPVMQLQDTLRERLQEFAPVSSAVSFARLGKQP